MKRILNLKCLAVLVLIMHSFTAYSQNLGSFVTNLDKGLGVDKVFLTDSFGIDLPAVRPLYSFMLNNTLHNSVETNIVKSDKSYSQIFENIVQVSLGEWELFGSGLKCELIFENIGNDTVSVSNVVPFGEDAGSVYITGKGPWDLARARLFRPGLNPVRIILPDNAWELGYTSFHVGSGT